MTEAPTLAAREFNEALGRALRAARRRAGLTLVEVQELTAGAFKTASASAYERGERSITVQRAAGLVPFYGTTIDALVEEAMSTTGVDYETTAMFDAVTPEEAVALAVADSRLEGLITDKKMLPVLLAVARGDIDVEDAVRERIARI
jgi:transcriptional regulator with XRE-family HTH domain